MTTPARHLHIADADTGEVLDGCPACRERDDVIDAQQRQIRGLILQVANLKRDAEAEARRAGTWAVAARLFVLWKRASGHARSRFEYDRYALIERFLRGEREARISPITGPPASAVEECVAAIIGRTADCYVSKRRNGTAQRFDEWERIFGAAGKGSATQNFEESMARRPRDWRARAIRLDPEIERTPPGQQGLDLDAGTAEAAD